MNVISRRDKEQAILLKEVNDEVRSILHPPKQKPTLPKPEPVKVHPEPMKTIPWKEYVKEEMKRKKQLQKQQYRQLIIRLALDRSHVLDLEDETDAKAQEVRDKYPVAILDFHYEPIQDVFLVSRIVVPHDKRGQGIGTAVMKDLVDYAKSKGKRIALTPVPEHPLNKNDAQRLDKFCQNVGFKRNRNKSINEDMIACREVSKFAAPQTYNDMGTTTKNVREWTDIDAPLIPESDKEKPVKKINTDIKDFKG